MTTKFKSFTNKDEFVITGKDAGRTIFSFIKKMYKDVSLSKIEKNFRLKNIKINNKAIDKKYILKNGDQIFVYNLFFKQSNLKQINFKKIIINFNVIYEDENILIINKKPFVSLHDEQNCLDHQVWKYLKINFKDYCLPAAIGRLDKLTSGIIVYGKNYQAIRLLKDKVNYFIKIYEFKSHLNKNIITTFKIQHNEKLQKQICGNVGKITKTKFWIENNKKYAQIFTGRKHQIRASLSKLGFPIFGDVKYGSKKNKRLFLHATYLKFTHLDNQMSYLNNQEFFSKPKW